MCTTSSSPGRRPTTAWSRSGGARGVALAWAAAALALGPGAARAAEETPEGVCVRVAGYETKVEGPQLHVRGQVTNVCPFVVRNVRVRVEARDKDGQTLGTGEEFAEPAVMGAQEGGRFDVPIATAAEPATVDFKTSWRRLGRY